MHVYPRPHLARFLQKLQSISDKTSLVLYTKRSPEYLTEVLKWIDGNGQVKHVFHGVDFADESGDGIISGKLGRDIEVMYRRIREKATGVPCQSVFDMNPTLK